MPALSGELASNAKLTWPQVRLIRRVYATGSVTIRTLAVLFGVANETIWKVLHHETWLD